MMPGPMNKRHSIHAALVSVDETIRSFGIRLDTAILMTPAAGVRRRARHAYGAAHSVPVHDARPATACSATTQIEIAVVYLRHPCGAEKSHREECDEPEHSLFHGLLLTISSTKADVQEPYG
jgi:hypothetical protein